MNPQEDIRVYDYVGGRNTVPMSDRYNFDADKLVNSGAIFITPAMDGDPNSPTYKEWLDEDGSHLITLYNVEHSSPEGWIRKAITKKSDTSGWRDNLIGKLYDGKYNQILWSLEKLGIDPNDMVIEDNSLQENINRIKEVMGLLDEGLHDTSWENDDEKITLIDLLNATEDIPVVDISVEELKPHLLTWDGDEDEIRKIESADLQYPILIFVNDDGNLISIIDGHHRAQKAVRNELETIKAKIIPINSLPENIKRVFKHMNLQESIRKILREELNKPSEKEFEKAINDVKVIIPLISHRILHDKNMEHNEENIAKLNKILLKKVKEGDNDILDEMWELAGSALMKNAINIITFYTK